MSAPRKPRGPPPQVPPGVGTGRPPPRPNGNGQVMRGVGAPSPEQKGPAPPPRGPPGNAKPAPMAPPPRTLLASSRPSVDSVKGINQARPPPRGLPGAGPPPSAGGGPGPPPRGVPRGLPPRALNGDFKATEYTEDKGKPIISNGNGRSHASSEAAAKTTARGLGATRKAGAIDAFDAPPVQEPADTKRPRTNAQKPFNPGLGPPPRPGVVPTADKRSDRPGPPSIHPAGIPQDSALPPQDKPKDKKGFEGAPPPVRTAPDRGRAPPRVEPGKKAKVPDPAPPPEESAPTKRGKKVIVEEEVYVPRRERENPEFESSSDEEGEDGVRRPKKTSKQLAEEEEARRKKEAAEAAKKRPAPASKDAEDEGIRASAEELAQAEAKKAQMGGKAVDAAPSGDARGQNEKMAAKEEEEEEVKEEEVEEEVPPVIEEDEEDPEAPPTNMPPSMGVSMATSTFVPPPPETFEPEFDTSKLASELTPGRLSIRCIAGINVRRKDEVNKVPKQDPFLKFKLGAAERHPWKSTEVQRKTDDNPDFQNEIVFLMC